MFNSFRPSVLCSELELVVFHAEREGSEFILGEEERASVGVFAVSYRDTFGLHRHFHAPGDDTARLGETGGLEVLVLNPKIEHLHKLASCGVVSRSADQQVQYAYIY